MQSLAGLGFRDEYFCEPLIDLGGTADQFSGIFMPSSEVGKESIGITHQFLDEAEVYHLKYTSDDRSSAREIEYAEMLAKYGLQTGRPLRILDIGAGSGGNTFVPLARLFPGSDYVATDLSPNLLAILSRIHRQGEFVCNLLCVCTDAARAPIRHDAFDLVVGSSILHHLTEPEAVIRCAYDVLRPGGVSLFFEPYESGHAVVGGAFRHILRLAPYHMDLDSRAEKVLTDMLLDWSVRVGRDKSDPIYTRLDDKWLFTETYLSDICRSVGFGAVSMLRRAPSSRKFVTFVETLLYLHSELPPDALPEWAWEIIGELDSKLSPDFVSELRLEDWFSVLKA